jgi:hypothetical protein
MVVMDHFSAVIGIAIYLVAFLALVGNWRLVETLRSRGAEYVALVLLAAAGLHMMVISSNLVLLFMGLETASIALYVIAGFARVERNSDEASLKYFLLGSFASAIFLYGVALVYAGTGSLSIYGSAGIRRWGSADRDRVDHRRPGVQGVCGTVPPVGARRLPGCCFGFRLANGRRCQDCGDWCAHPLADGSVR